VSDPNAAGTGTSRAAFRVSAELPIRYRPLAAAEAARLALEIEQARDGESELPARLADRLQRIEHKLDLVLHQLDPSQPPPLSARDGASIALSAAGVALAAKQALPLDSLVLVELLLPGPAPRPVRAVARVARCQEKRGPEAGLLLAFAFRAIHCDDREAIARFANEVQRADLRRRSEARGA